MISLSARQLVSKSVWKSCFPLALYRGKLAG